MIYQRVTMETHSKIFLMFLRLKIELEAAPQFLCMYGCNEVFTSQLQRSNHHRQNKNHREDYRKLRAQCDGGFKCKFCGKTIKNYRALSGHVKCTRTKNYLDFFELAHNACFSRRRRRSGGTATNCKHLLCAQILYELLLRTTFKATPFCYQ